MREKMKLIILITLPAMILVSCLVDDDDRLQKVRVIYGPEYATVIVPVTCSSIEYDLIGVKRKVITENDLLKSLDRELGKLNIDSEGDLSIKTVDVRIKCFLDYQERTDTLCLGEFNGALLNGKLMNDSQKLLGHLKSIIYQEEE